VSSDGEAGQATATDAGAGAAAETNPAAAAAPPGKGQALARLAFLRDADPAALAEAATRARWLAAVPGELVLDFGDATDDVFLVVEGSVRVVVRTPLGQEVILGDLGPGEVFGEMAAIDGATRSASVTALHASRLCRMPGPVFLRLALASPAVALRLMRVLTARLRLQDERMTELAVLPVRHRLAAELLRLSRPRGNGAAERVISPLPPQHVIAARIAARRETVSLALSQLAREGLTEVTPRAIIVPRPEALRASIEAQLREGKAERTADAGAGR
jgi:CRP-like cAMP-binding protein